MKSLDELKVIRERAYPEVSLRKDAQATGKVRAHVLVCAGTGCTSSGSQKILARLEEELKANNLQDEIKIIFTLL